MGRTKEEEEEEEQKANRGEEEGERERERERERDCWRARSAGRTGTEREFNSTVDYAASLPDYCRYAFPFCADEGITLRVYHVRARERTRVVCVYGTRMCLHT